MSCNAPRCTTTELSGGTFADAGMYQLPSSAGCQHAVVVRERSLSSAQNAEAVKNEELKAELIDDAAPALREAEIVLSARMADPGAFDFERDHAQAEVDALRAEHERLKKAVELEESTILRLLRERSGDAALEMPEVTFGAEDRRTFQHAGVWAWSTLQGKPCWSCCLSDVRKSKGCAPVMHRLIHCEMSARRTKRSFRPRTAKT